MAAKAASTQTGVAATSADTIEDIPMRSTASAAKPTPRARPTGAIALRAMRPARWRGVGFGPGSSEGSRRGGEGSTASAARTPSLAAARAARPSGRGCSSAYS